MAGDCALVPRPSLLGPGLRRGSAPCKTGALSPARQENPSYRFALPFPGTPRREASASPAKAGAQERAGHGGGCALVPRPALLGPGLRRGSAPCKTGALSPARQENPSYRFALPFPGTPRREASASPAKAGAQERAGHGGGCALLPRPALLGPGLRRGSGPCKTGALSPACQENPSLSFCHALPCLGIPRREASLPRRTPGPRSGRIEACAARVTLAYATGPRPSPGKRILLSTL